MLNDTKSPCQVSGNQFAETKGNQTMYEDFVKGHNELEKLFSPLLLKEHLLRK